MRAICTESYVAVTINIVEIHPHHALPPARLRALLDKFGVISVEWEGGCFIDVDDIPAVRDALAGELALGATFRPLDVLGAPACSWGAGAPRVPAVGIFGAGPVPQEDTDGNDDRRDVHDGSRRGHCVARRGDHLGGPDAMGVLVRE